MSELFGWDLVYKVSEEDTKKKEDVLVLFVHFLLIKNGYRCVGLGDDKTLTGNETTSEMLPTGWSSCSGTNYSLRYALNNQLFILRGVISDNSILFNLLQVSTLGVSSIVLDTEETVRAVRGTLVEMVPSYEGLMARIRRELLERHIVPGNKEATTQTAQQQPTLRSSMSGPPHPFEPAPAPSPLSVGPPQMGRPPAAIDPFWNDPERDPLRVGHNDLDPLGRGRGGGMIFNPFQPHGGGIPDPGMGIPGSIPPGAVPPGARFDPFGPPGFPDRPRPRPPPDSDHFEPPGFGGMFM